MFFMNHNTAGDAGVLGGVDLAAEARSEVGVVACGEEVPAPKVGLGGGDVPVYECPVGGCFSFV
jgi:hypothetical protein